MRHDDVHFDLTLALCCHNHSTGLLIVRSPAFKRDHVVSSMAACSADLPLLGREQRLDDPSTVEHQVSKAITIWIAMTRAATGWASVIARVCRKRALADELLHRMPEHNTRCKTSS